VINAEGSLAALVRALWSKPCDVRLVVLWSVARITSEVALLDAERAGRGAQDGKLDTEAFLAALTSVTGRAAWTRSVRSRARVVEAQQASLHRGLCARHGPTPRHHPARALDLDADEHELALAP